MFSVVIPLYNKETSIKSTIESILAQTEDNFEIIVVDDGSTDEGPTYVRGFSDNRIKLVSQKNRGVSSARNFGVEMASREYIAFLDADDLWMPNHLESIKRLIEKHGATCDVFASGVFTDETPIENQRILSKSGKIESYFLIASGPYRLLSSSSFAVSRKAFIASGGYNESLKYSEDVEFWCRLFLSGFKLAYSSELTVTYRTSAQNRSGKISASPDLRFSDFSCLSRTGHEGLYRGKLVMVLLIDQVSSHAFTQAMHTALREWRILHFSILYLMRLIFSRIKIACN